MLEFEIAALSLRARRRTQQHSQSNTVPAHSKWLAICQKFKRQPAVLT